LSAFCREVQARGSLILGHETTSLASEREALRNEHLYEQMVDVRSHDPTQFDHFHPILGDLLTEQSSFEYWLNRWQAHPARFEHWHPRFWRIIDGEALEGGPPVIPLLIPPAGQGGDPPVAPGPLSPLGQPGLASPAAAVPEPDSFRLLLVALGLILVVRVGSRYLRAWIPDACGRG
ncbi:MAG: PEP-CTERM sorting domain-containing protein, partial [Isosphaeraceae bacterium]